MTYANVCQLFFIISAKFLQSAFLALGLAGLADIAAVKQ